jgi:hypothetical protein
MLARALVVLALVVVVTFGIHRALTAMERRGWIYYRTKGTGSMGASALFGLNEMFHPDGHVATIERQQQDLRGARRQVPGDPRDPADPQKHP